MSEHSYGFLELVAKPLSLPFGSDAADEIRKDAAKSKIPVAPNAERESSRVALLATSAGSLALAGVVAGLTSSALPLLLVGSVTFGLMQAGMNAYYQEKYHAAKENNKYELSKKNEKWKFSRAAGIFGQLVLRQIACAAMYAVLGAAAGAMVGAAAAGVGAAGGASVGAALGFSLAMGLSGGVYYRDSVRYRRRAKDIEDFRAKSEARAAKPKRGTFDVAKNNGGMYGIPR